MPVNGQISQQSVSGKQVQEIWATFQHGMKIDQIHTKYVQ